MVGPPGEAGFAFNTPAMGRAWSRPTGPSSPSVIPTAGCKPDYFIFSASFRNGVTSSIGSGKTMVEFFSAEISTQRLQVAELQRARGAGDDVGGLAQLLGGLELALGGDDLGAPLALGLGLLGHGAPHLLGQVDLLHLDGGDLHAPGLGVPVDDLLQLPVDLVALARAGRPARPGPSTERRVVWANWLVAKRKSVDLEEGLARPRPPGSR